MVSDNAAEPQIQPNPAEVLILVLMEYGLGPPFNLKRTWWNIKWS